MSRLVKVVAVLQIVGGLYGLLATCGGVLADASAGSIAVIPVIVASINLVSLVAGVGLWRERPSGRKASIVVQAMQLPKIVSPAITFMISFGFDFWVYFLLGDPLNLGFQFRFLGFNQFFVNMPGAPIGVGISLTSCISLPVLFRYKPQASVQEMDRPRSTDQPTT